MTKIQIAKKYLQLLEAADTEGIIHLFAPGAMVYSPLYGAKPAAEFYQQLAQDTNNSEIKPNGIFTEAGSNRIALYFAYTWTLKDGRKVEFEVVDIIAFNEKEKIEKLTIIYDTVRSRELIRQLKESG